MGQRDPPASLEHHPDKVNRSARIGAVRLRREGLAVMLANMGSIRGPALLASVLVLAGCARLLPGEGRSVEPPDSGAPAVAVDGEAPPECGFPAGTVLSYSGRSTTAELDVQEVVGDAMSDDPADIYITRDKFDQGEKHGRLVCAVFVDHPGFVEVTVHPEDGGRFVPPTPLPSVTPPPGGISVDDATDIALAEVPEPDTWAVGVAEAGPLERMMDGTYLDADWAAGLPGDRWVWRIFLSRGDAGVDVVLDYLDGSVMGTVEYIVD
jgi:hypothetical protein